MKETLTFNIEEITKNNFQFIKINETDTGTWKNKDEFKEPIKSTFKVSSSDLRKFIEDTFGIRMDIDMSHNRNQLNSLIKKVTTTQKGKRTFLNLNEYIELIKLEDFNSFIVDNIEKDFKIKDRKKLRNELMHLQVARYKNTIYYKNDNMLELQSFAYYLGIFKTLNRYLNFWYEQPFLRDTHIETENEDINNLLNIINNHYDNNEITKNKFRSVEDIESTSEIQKIYTFLRDIQTVDNKKANHY